MRRVKAPVGGRPLAVVLMTLGILWSGHVPAVQAALSESYEPMQAVTETGHPGLLSLTSSVQPLRIPWLEPGDSFTWQIGLHLADQPLGGGTLEFIPAGSLLSPDAGYLLTAKRCETQWAGTSGTGKELACASGATTLLDEAPMEAGATPRIPLGNVTSDTSPHVLFTLSLPEQTLPEAALPEKSLPKDGFTFALGFTVMGDDAAGSNKLAKTGLAAAGFLAVAVLLLGAGLIVKLAGRSVGKS